LGRLHLPDLPKRFVPRQLARNGFRALPVNMAHALAVQELPPLHRDPFDRLLVAQSQLEKLPIVSDDAWIARYDAQTLW
jgi:PIN domain nuclease of toxin-antitoxin system